MEIVIGLSFLTVLLIIAVVMWSTGVMRPERGHRASHTQVRHPQETGRSTGIN